MYNLDLFSDLNKIKTMAASAAAPAIYFHGQQKSYCVLALSEGKTFAQLCQDFRVKYANAGPGYKREPPSCKKTVARYTVN